MTIEQSIQLALDHHRAGRLPQAEAIYRRVLAQQPNHAEALYLLGVMAAQVGKIDPAIELIRRAISINPRGAHYHLDLGQILAGCGRSDEAIAALRQALALQPNNPAILSNLGSALNQRGNTQEAIAAYQAALTLDANFAEVHYNLGVCLRLIGRNQEAVEAFQKAILLRPDFPEARNNLGNALQAIGKPDEAIAELQEALRLRAAFPEAHNNLGNILREKDQREDAIVEYRKALAISPDFAEAHNNLGTALMEIARYEEAIPEYRRTLELVSQHTMAHYNLSLSLLLLGQFREGWREHEWRWKVPELGLILHRFPQPLWDGSDLGGRRILLYAEQGFGDTIQFSRYARMVADRGGKVILALPRGLVKLLRRIDGVEQVTTDGEPMPEFEVQSPLFTLPMLFDTTLETIPAAIPYIRTDAELVERWRGRLPGDRLKVGLSWAGRPSFLNDRYRSISPTLLTPLQRSGAAFFSLQKGRVSQDIDLSLTDWTAELNDFADTAALIENLDLVIAVDTAVAHLAGAMGKRVWLLLPFAPDWRWMLNRDDSPWYPTMRIFRQPRAGDWQAVITQVLEALRSFV